MIVRGNKIVDGVSFARTMYKATDGGVTEQSQMCFIGENRAVKQVTYAMAVMDTPVIYAADKTATTYGEANIEGTVIPVQAVVHISEFYGTFTPEALIEHEIASAPSDEEGNWSCTVSVDGVARICAWISFGPDYATASAAELTIKKDSGETPGEAGAYTISTSFSAEAESIGGTTCSIYLQGAGPSDLSNLKLYATDPDSGEETQVDLYNDSFSSGGGQWNLNGNFNAPSQPYTDFRVTGDTDDKNGAITVEKTQYTLFCLAGNTLITLADGTEKRLDALTAEDMVLGGDGKPAGIIRIARGQWNPCHTLYRFDDGTVVDEVHEHRFFNVEQGFWQKLKNWHVGEHARRIDGGTAALLAVERIRERAEMFGLWVERCSYWANGLLSGDAEANLPLLCDATAEQAAEMAASLPEREIARLLGKETGE